MCLKYHIHSLVQYWQKFTHFRLKFYGEVEREVQKFRESLHTKLLQMPAPLEEKKKIIRHLVDLEYAGTYMDSDLVLFFCSSAYDCH